MAQSNNIGTLKAALVIFAVVSIIYGLGFLLIPGSVLALSGGDPIDFGWLRWSGGILVGLGIGASMVFRRPEKQGIFISMSALGMLFGGLGLLYSWIAKEYTSYTLFIALPAVLLLVISGLLWWGKKKARAIL